MLIKRLKKKKIYLFSGIIVFTLLIQGFNFFAVVLPKSTEATALKKTLNFSAGLLLDSEDSYLEQGFYCEEPLTGIAVLAGSFGGEEDSAILQTILYDDTKGEELEKVKTPLGVTKGNFNLSIQFSQTYSIAEQKYRVKISVLETDKLERHYLLWTTKENAGEIEDKLLYSGEQREDYLKLDLYGKPKNIIAFFVIICSGVDILLLIGYWVICKKRPLQQIFVVLALGLGVLYMLVYPSYAVNDENIHITSTIARATAWENGKWDHPSEMQNIKIRVSEQQEVYTGLKPTAGHYAYLFDTALDGEKSGTIDMTIEKTVGFTIEYIPQICGILLARLLHLGQTPTLYLAQFMALVFYVACGYIAIRLSPFPELFTVIALFPMAVRSAGSFSYDSFINAVSLIYVALLLKFIYDARTSTITVWQLMLTFCLGIILAPCKIIYIPLSLLLFAVPKEKWKKKRHRWFFICTETAISIFVGIYMNTAVLTRSVSSGNTFGPWGNLAYSMSDLVTHPFEMIRLTLSTMINQALNLVFMGVGGLQYVNIENTIVVGFILLALFSIPRQQSLIVTRKQKLLYAFLWICVAGLGYAAALTWTTVGSYYIMGMQGRYMIPLFPILFLIGAGAFARQPERDVVLYSNLVLHSYCILDIFLRVIW